MPLPYVSLRGPDSASLPQAQLCSRTSPVLRISVGTTPRLVLERAGQGGWAKGKPVDWGSVSRTDDLSSRERGGEFPPVQLSPGLGFCYGTENRAVEHAVEGASWSPGADKGTDGANHRRWGERRRQGLMLARQGTSSRGLQRSVSRSTRAAWVAGRQRGAVFLTFVPLASLLLGTDPGS